MPRINIKLDDEEVRRAVAEYMNRKFADVLGQSIVLEPTDVELDVGIQTEDRSSYRHAVFKGAKVEVQR